MQNNKMYGVSSWIWCGITPCWTVDGGGAKFEVALNNKLRWWRAMQSNPMNTKLPPFVRQCLTNVWHGQLECAPIPWPTNYSVICYVFFLACICICLCICLCLIPVWQGHSEFSPIVVRRVQLTIPSSAPSWKTQRALHATNIMQHCFIVCLCVYLFSPLSLHLSHVFFECLTN